MSTPSQEAGEGRGGDREWKNTEKSMVDVHSGGKSDDGGYDGKSRDRRRDERSPEEKRPKREREEVSERKERHRERRFREVKERVSPIRESSRERSWRPTDRGRWVAEVRPKPRWEQDQDKAPVKGGQRYGRRPFPGGSGPGGGFGRYYGGGDRDSRPGNWGGDGYNGRNRDVSYRRPSRTYQSKGDKWKHDMFETVAESDKIVPEEDPISKIEALLAS